MAVENLPEFVFGWEVVVDKFEKTASNFCGHIITAWWVFVILGFLFVAFNETTAIYEQIPRLTSDSGKTTTTAYGATCSTIQCYIIFQQ